MNMTAMSEDDKAHDGAFCCEYHRHRARVEAERVDREWRERHESMARLRAEDEAYDRRERRLARMVRNG